MKNPIKRLAALCVTAYANRTFRKAIRVADSWQGATHRRHYVITDPNDESRLVTISTDGFLQLRHELGIRSKDCTIAYLKKTCWYYTPNNEGRDVIPARELVIRRLSFVRMCLERAKLIPEKRDE